MQLDDAMMPAASNGGKATGAPWSKSDGFSAGATKYPEQSGCDGNPPVDVCSD